MDESLKNKIRASFQAGKAEVLSSSEDGTISYRRVDGVHRHNTPHKKMVRTVLTGGLCVLTTEDHSLYLWEDGGIAETLASDLMPGAKLVVNDGGDKVGYLEVTEVSEEEPRKFTYDLSVDGNHNFFLTSGILAHNTYSISGVSLDVDKSSKYMGMKENYEAEFDKALEQAKRSIKIVKGLQQPRFGVGISSALGPFNRVGTQSRSNYVGGGGYWN